MRAKRNKWDSGPSKPLQAPAVEAATPEALRKKAQEAAAKLMAQRQHDQAMCEEIVINDHPINIRDQLTRRAALVSVEQQTGTTIVVKGRYYPPGAPRAPNNPPLLLHITAANHLGTDEFTKRTAVSRAAAHIHAILRGQATPMSPVPPHPSNMPLSPPPDMIFRPDAPGLMRPGLPMQPRMQMPPPGYITGPPRQPQHPVHAQFMHAPPMAIPGHVPQLQPGMPTAAPGPGPGYAMPSQVMPASSAPLVTSLHHQQHHTQARPDLMPHVAAPLPHPSVQAQPSFYGQAPPQAQQPPPNSATFAGTSSSRASAPGSALEATSDHSNAAQANPQATTPGLAASIPPSKAQAGNECSIAIDFSGPPGFDIVERLRGPENSYISHIGRETGASIELRGQGSGSQAGADQPLHIHICHTEPWRLKPAEDLIHSLLQTVRAAATARGVVPAASHDRAPQPHARPLQPVTSAHPAAPSSGQMHHGGWPGPGVVHGHQGVAWPAVPHGLQLQPVQHQPAAFGGHLHAGQQHMPVPGQWQSSSVHHTSQQCYQHPERSKLGFDCEAAGPTSAPTSSVLSASRPALPSSRPSTGNSAADGGPNRGSEQGQGRPQPAKRKFREFKEEPKITQIRAAVLPSYYKHLADDTEGTGVVADAKPGDRDRSDRLVYGPEGPPEGHSHRAGLGAPRQSDAAPSQQGPATRPQQPPVGLLVPYDED